jgi:hypothetical protein
LPVAGHGFIRVLVGPSPALAMLSASLYLRRQRAFSWASGQQRAGYLTILFGTIVAVNILVRAVMFPAAAKLA